MARLVGLLIALLLFAPPALAGNLSSSAGPSGGSSAPAGSLMLMGVGR